MSFSCSGGKADASGAQGRAKITTTVTGLENYASYFWIAVEAGGKWTIALDFGGAEAWASLRQTSGSGDGIVGCDYEANTGDSARSLTIIITSEGGLQDRLILSQNGSSVVPPVPPTPVGDIPAWMEIPSQRSDLKFYSHNFTMSGKTYRNYSFGWSAQNHLAIWVAYPLCDDYLGSLKRTDDWDFDPDVPANEQANLTSSYVNTDGCSWDRGHQLPSGDRTCCAAANNQTFYFSNMTPQLGALNQQFWQNLENNVRYYSSNVDTLYVVTGAIMEGSKHNAKDRSGLICPCPGKYFKALLGKMKKSTSGHSGWIAAGFLVEHKAYNNTSTKDVCVSIRDLEKAAGLDFFPALKEVVGEETYDLIEKENPVYNSFWW